jgi:hypothetical protein
MIDPEAVQDLTPAAIGLPLFKTYTGQYGYVAAGIGVRNVARGTINVRVPFGVTLVDAWLYWTILDNSSNLNPLNNKIDVNGIRVHGDLIGSGISPCWLPDRGYTYRGRINEVLWGTGGAAGGAFGLTVGGVSTSMAHGESPWREVQKAPEAEYVGVVIVYQDTTLPSGRIQIYNGYWEGAGICTFSYVWPARTVGSTRFSSLSADGQMSANPFDKYLDFNGTVIDKPVLNGYDPSIASRSAYEGSLADTDTYNLGTKVPMAGGATTITWNTQSDCICWAALVFHSGCD